MSLDWLSNAQKKDSTELSPLSTNAAFLLNEGSKKKKSEEMKLYLLQKQAALRIYPHQAWPLPVWLGGRYANVVKPGYPLRCPTKAQFWTISHLHLAICTAKYLYTPYVTHNKPRISVRLANGQFSSFRNEHFFEQTSFEKFEELDLEFFQNCPVVTYIQRHEDEDEETGDEDASSQSSLPILTETDSDLDDDDDAPLGAPTRTPIPLPPLVPLNNANLPFMQNFVANIFIF